MYQRIGKAAYKVDLFNTKKLMTYLGEPQFHFKTLHIAGTNGKGSTSHMLASVLQEAGYKTGLYTSPHLKDFRERIKINGKMIPKDKVSEFVSIHKPFFETNQLSFFEMTVGLGFDFFRKEKVDIAVIEVGLGGRLDSTNIITPEVSVITNIGLDHTQFLGNTKAAIAYEKAGIIKPEIPVVIGEIQTDTKDVFLKIASRSKSPIIFVEEKINKYYKTDLLGNYQEKNCNTALQTIKILKDKGWIIPEEAIEKGLLHIGRNTGLLGRWQILQDSPKVICDIAHNREGLCLVLQQLEEEPFSNLHLVLGFVNDKNLDGLLGLFPKNALYYFCKPNVERGLKAEILKEKSKEYNLKGHVFSSVQKAYKTALKNALNSDLIYVGGSTFVVAEVL